MADAYFAGVMSLCLSHQVFQRAHFMPEVGFGDEVLFDQGQLVQILDELVRKNFSEWSQNLDRQSLKRLEQPLIVRCKMNTSKLDINFDK